MSNRFVHLHTHSGYSVVDSTIRIQSGGDSKTMAEHCVSEGQVAVALTDVMNLFGLVFFYRSCIDKGIKPIVGAEVNVKTEWGIGTMLLLVMNHQGYCQLNSLLTMAWESPQYQGNSVVDSQWLKGNCSGLIALCGGTKGIISPVALNQADRLSQTIEHWSSLFQDRFYLEIHRIGDPLEELWIEQAVHISQSHSIPVVATNKVCFLEREDFLIHQTRVCISRGLILGNEEAEKLYSEEQYFRSQAEMEFIFQDCPSAISNTAVVASRCNLQLVLGEPKLPKFSSGSEDLEDSFSEKVHQGLEKKLQAMDIDSDESQPYWTRLKGELDVIIKMNYVGYFLIVNDFIQWAKKQGIPVGPRGSGAASLVSYALDITNINPIKYNLLFERFLNVERKNMPDLDIDFCVERRNEVIDYVVEKYGKSQVAQIVTFGKLAARGVVRDVVRVMGLPYGLGERISQLIPASPAITLDQALTESDELKSLYQSDKEVHSVIVLAKKLEGLVRNVGKHAGGVVIAPKPLKHYCPLYKDPNQPDSHAVAQFDKDAIEDIGLVKFDFLGVNALTTIDRSVKWINRLKNESEPEFNVENLDFNDPDVYRMISNGDTVAVFQIESAAARRHLKDLQPDRFEDLIAMNALNRPGPLNSGMTESYIKRSRKLEEVEVLHPQLEGILEETYGVIAYQEQVMLIAQKLAKYTLGHADILRQAMSKKDTKKMADERKEFVRKSCENGIEEEKALQIFDYMEKFAEYGFNKSHSVVYSVSAYLTGFLKCHHPSAFFAATMTNEINNLERLMVLKRDAENRGIEFVSVDVNASQDCFVPLDKKRIFYSIAAIKGVGKKVATDIQEERDKKGDFLNLFDFCLRLGMKKLNRRILEKLIYSGTLDGFSIDRSTLLLNIDQSIVYAQQQGTSQQVGQISLFKQASKETKYPTYISSVSPFPPLYLLEQEKSLLGYHVEKSPYNILFSEFKHYGIYSIKQLFQKQQSKRFKKQQIVAVLGEIEKVNIDAYHSKIRYNIRIVDGSRELEAEILQDRLPKNIDKSSLKAGSLWVFWGEMINNNYTSNRLRLKHIDSLADVRKAGLKEVVLITNQDQISELHHTLQHASIYEESGKKETNNHLEPVGKKLLDGYETLVPCKLIVRTDQGEMAFNSGRKIFVNNNISVWFEYQNSFIVQWVAKNSSL